MRIVIHLMVLVALAWITVAVHAIDNPGLAVVQDRGTGSMAGAGPDPLPAGVGAIGE